MMLVLWWHCQIDDDEVNGVSSGKGSSDYSCASSVTDEEGIGIQFTGRFNDWLRSDKIEMPFLQLTGRFSMHNSKTQIYLI